MEQKDAVAVEVAAEKYKAAAQNMVVASDELYRAAVAISDGYWAAVAREADKLESFFIYGVRVRRRVYGVSIEWMKGKSIGTGETKRMIFFSIPRGNGVSYRRSSFRRAKPWEMEEIAKAEAQFVNVRNASDGLAEAGRRMRWIKKALERGGEVDAKRIRDVLATAEEACGAVSSLTRVDLAAETECVS